MKKRMRKAGILLVVFVAAVFVSSLFMNNGVDDQIIDLGDPTLPRISFQKEGRTVNALAGYVNEMDVTAMRDTITPLEANGTLQIQIEEGSRCDIFFSAATKQMDALVDEELADKDSVVDLLENKVVLIKPKDGETKVTGFENITDAENIALAGEDVPVGQYSREIFKNLGIEDDVNKMEINEGKNVTEVLASVSEGSNEIGIVYATDAASVADKVDIIAEAPAGSLETPVLYLAGLTIDSEASDSEAAAAKAFLEYLQTDDAMKVFEEYGFAQYRADDEKEAAEETDADTAEETEATEETK